MSSVLVTGAAGFIGSNLVRRLVDSGHDVAGVDDMSSGRMHLLSEEDRRRVVHADFTDDHVLIDVSSGRYDIIVHLAARPRVSDSVTRPLETNDVNVSKTLRLMEAAKGKIKRFVFSSSAAVYGDVFVPAHESAIKRPKSPYALQKSIIEDYLGLWRDYFKFDAVVLRFFNVYGPGQLHNSPYSSVISAWSSAVVRGDPLRLDGDGHQTRDFCHVDDVTSAIERSIDLSRDFGGYPINVASGVTTRIVDVLDEFVAINPSCEVVRAPPRTGDVKWSAADVARARIHLGHTPKMTLPEGIRRTVDWYRRVGQFLE